MSEERKADFRYNTGPSKVPWAAVGECVEAGDIMDIIRFLMRPGDDKAAWETRMEALEAALCETAAVSQYATKLSLGEAVKEVERQACEYLKCKYACFITNATAGFEIGFKYADIQPGDEVIAPAITFITTVNYPLTIGTKVVFADLDPRTINMDPADVERKITPRTKAIIPVHIGGYPVDMGPLMEIARKHDLVVVEDCAHAFGGSYDGKMLGTIGDFGSYSFHEVKNCTSLGEGGLLVTDNDDFGPYLGRARFAGLDLSLQIPNWLYDVIAIPGKGAPFVAANHSSTEIQAVGLMSQMGRIERIMDIRRKNAEYLNSRFAQCEGIITPPLDDEKVKSTHHLYLLQIDPDIVGHDIQELKPLLDQRGITQIPHFAPLYKFQLFAQLGYDADEIAATCPVTEEVFNRRFTHLPLYPLTQEQVQYMADNVIEAVEELKAR